MKTILDETNHMRKLMGLGEYNTKKINEIFYQDNQTNIVLENKPPKHTPSFTSDNSQMMADTPLKGGGKIKDIFDKLKNKFKNKFKKGKISEVPTITKEDIIYDIKTTKEEILNQTPIQYRDDVEQELIKDFDEIVTHLTNDDWDDDQLDKEGLLLYKFLYGSNGSLIYKFHQTVKKVNFEEPGLLGGYLDNIMSDEISGMLVTEGAKIINEGVISKLMGNLAKRYAIKQRGNEIESGYELLKASEQELSALVKKMKTTNLGFYKNNLKAMVMPLSDIYEHSYLMNQKDCDEMKKRDRGTHRKEIQGAGTTHEFISTRPNNDGKHVDTRGTRVKEALKNGGVFGAVDDLVQSIEMEMKMELQDLGVLQLGDDFTHQTAIEMLYKRYQNQKGLLTKIGKGMIQIVGGASVDGQMLGDIKEYIREKYPSTGGVLNTIIMDFIGGVAMVYPDYSLTQCY
tara:strand:- start:310 stop:1677 length:1368 start_codon:yes stop_codon:yes gene_type:complete